MKNRYRLVRRAYGIYYCLDKQTRKKESLETSDWVKAERLLMAKNQSVEQPALNKGMAPDDLERGVIQFIRRKLMGKDGGNSFLRIGPRLSALLAQLPESQ